MGTNYVSFYEFIVISNGLSRITSANLRTWESQVRIWEPNEITSENLILNGNLYLPHGWVSLHVAQQSQRVRRVFI